MRVGVGVKGIHTFLKNINLKVHVMVGLKFEIAYCDVTVSHFSHYITGTPHFIGIVGRVFANSPGDLGSIPVRVIPKT